MDCLRRHRIHSSWVLIQSWILVQSLSYFLAITTILGWMIKMRRIEIIMKVSLLSSHVALPREGHLEAAIHVMAHVGQRYNSRLVYDSLYPEIDHSVFKNMIDKSSIGMPKRQYLQMPQSLQIKRLISTCLLIVIMKGTKCVAD